jgi:hypothetical protein
LVGQSQLVSIEMVPGTLQQGTTSNQEPAALSATPEDQPAGEPAVPQFPGTGQGSQPASSQPPPGGAGRFNPPPGESAGANQPKLPELIFPDPLPVTPPGLPPLQTVAATVVDLGSLLPVIMTNMPAAPTRLEAGFEHCTVRLTWYDNSENETHYNIWMQRLGGPPQLIMSVQGSPNTGPAWTEFKAPAFGIYSFWVEAANSLGSQPSLMVGLAVNDATCPQDILATRLVIEALDMHVGGGYEQVYCYLSLEGAAARRIPDGSGYINVHNQWGDIVKHWGGDKSIQLPIPADEEVLLEGECLGMGVSGPVSLGKFQESAQQSTWDGQRLEVNASGFSAGYRIYPLGSEKAQGVYFATDYSILSPEIIDVITDTPQDPNSTVEEIVLARRPTIRWKWDGDEAQITSYSIYLDGKLYQWAEPAWRKTRLVLPDGCDVTYQLTMTANANQSQSVPGMPFTYTTPPCPLMASVHYQTIYVEQTDDTSFNPFDVADSYKYSPCDQMGVKGRLWVVGTDRVETFFGSNQMPLHFTCKTLYGFKQHLAADPDILNVPVDPEKPYLRFGAEVTEVDDFGNDLFVDFYVDVPVDPATWDGYEKLYDMRVPSQKKNTAIGINIKVLVKGFRFKE